MKNPSLDVAALLPMTLQKSVHQPLYPRADHLGNILRQQNVKSAIAQIESHRAERIGKRIRLRNQNHRPTHFSSAHYDSSRPVTEQNRRDQVRLRNVLA